MEDSVAAAAKAARRAETAAAGLGPRVEALAGEGARQADELRRVRDLVPPRDPRARSPPRRAAHVWAFTRAEPPSPRRACVGLYTRGAPLAAPRAPETPCAASQRPCRGCSESVRVGPPVGPGRDGGPRWRQPTAGVGPQARGERRGRERPGDGTP